MTMTADRERHCPGCTLRMPFDGRAAYDGYYNCSPECWSVYAELLGFEFSNAVLFGQVHQMSVDSYALQHAGGPHPDKSVAIHLAGLHAAFNLGIRQTQIPRLLQQLAATVQRWPHFPPPESTGPMTVFDVALADSLLEHVARVQKWAGFVWDSWSDTHRDVASLVRLYG
ncbi:MAG: DUF5946 family protein [Anaerolineae bacterium]